MSARSSCTVVWSVTERCATSRTRYPCVALSAISRSYVPRSRSVSGSAVPLRMTVSQRGSISETAPLTTMMRLTFPDVPAPAPLVSLISLPPVCSRSAR